ncbi:MAG: hypothetical protein KF823_02055 [Xanthomonadales bacterium]|nr:hypothetical protein [Xanthomonadales bacterium]
MSRFFASPRSLLWLLAASLLVAAGTVLADPPGRVARLAWLSGDASFAPAGESQWYRAGVNRPLVAGDRLWTGRDGRAELQLGTGLLRLDADTGIELLNLDDYLLQVELAEGVVNLRIDEWGVDESYEINTPNLAFVSGTPGSYRLDIAPDGRSTQVTVFEGSAEVYGADGRSLRLRAGSSTRFHDTRLRDVQRMAMPRPDSFDRWVQVRDDRYLRSASRQYVAPGLIGYADLDEWGTWRSHRDYGHVWFPRNVRAGWAPYRYGHWSWIEPWGWTWIDDAPWGFAPSHYGRWVYVSNGWGWVPGPRHVRPVWAPAMVAFVGGSNWSLAVSTGGPPIGWFPLGPRDVYVPWYRVSRPYFGRINVHNTVVINNTYVTNIYNDYYVQGRPVSRDYTFRTAANAVTVVPRDTFVTARNAAESMARLRPGALEQGELLGRAPAAPTRASLSGEMPSRQAPSARIGEREVIARTEPARPMVPFEQRERAIARNGGEPLAREQVDRLGRGETVARDRIRLVEGARQSPTGGEPGVAPDRGQSARGELSRPAAPSVDDRGRDGRDARGDLPTSRPPISAPDRDRGGGAREAIRAPRQDDARPSAPAVPSERGIPLPRSGAPADRDRSAAPVRQMPQEPVAAPRIREQPTPPQERPQQLRGRDSGGQRPPVEPPVVRGMESEARPSAPSRAPARGMDAPPASRVPAPPRQEAPTPSRQTSPESSPIRQQTPATPTRQRQEQDDDGGREGARAVGRRGERAF